LESSNITFSNKDSIQLFIGIQDCVPKKKERNSDGEIKFICHKLEHSKGTTHAAFISNPWRG